jgi:hypothetical protein
MPDCTDRKQLLVQYQDAVVIFSASVSVLEELSGNGHHNFADQYQATEQARLHVENARLMLVLHRDEHCC